MIESKDPLLHWNYFLALEQDLEKCTRLSFLQKNYTSYSIEFAHLLFASSSKVDVVAKLICSLLDSTKQPERIHEYREIILSKIKGFSQEMILIPRFGLKLTPWNNWQDSSSPDWWKSYNNVKHERDSHFDEANLKNTLNSMAALLITMFYFYKLKFEHEFERKENEMEMNTGVVLMRLHTQPSLLGFPDHYYSGTPFAEWYG